MGAGASAGSLDRAAAVALAGDRFDPVKWKELSVANATTDAAGGMDSPSPRLLAPGALAALDAWQDPGFNRPRSLEGTHFVDGGGGDSGGHGGHGGHGVHWRSKAALPAVADDVTYSDAKQGHQGDCFLVAAMALLAMHPRRLRDVVRKKEKDGGRGGDKGKGEGGGGEGDGGDGGEGGEGGEGFVVRLYRGGRWVEVEVDGYVPYITGYGSTPLYTHCRRDAQGGFAAVEKAVRLWMLIIRLKISVFY